MMGCDIPDRRLTYPPRQCVCLCVCLFELVGHITNLWLSVIVVWERGESSGWWRAKTNLWAWCVCWENISPSTIGYHLSVIIRLLPVWDFYLHLHLISHLQCCLAKVEMAPPLIQTARREITYNLAYHMHIHEPPLTTTFFLFYVCKPSFICAMYNGSKMVSSETDQLD